MSPKQKKYLLIGIFLLLFANLKIAMLLWWQAQRPQHSEDTACNPAAAQGCVFAGSQTLHLHGVGGNKIPFSAVMANLPPETQSVSLSFEMQGMDMGFNRFDLSHAGGGTWRVDNIYLPLCSANRHDWTAKWQIDGRTYSAAFQTQAP